MTEYRGFVLNEPSDKAPWGKIEFDLFKKLIDVALDGIVDPTDHNALSNLQGGVAFERYHLLLSEVEKLTGIEPFAQVNVNSDWDATSGDAEILNKPLPDGWITQYDGDSLDYVLYPGDPLCITEDLTHTQQWTSSAIIRITSTNSNGVDSVQVVCVSVQNRNVSIPPASPYEPAFYVQYQVLSSGNDDFWQAGGHVLLNAFSGSVGGVDEHKAMVMINTASFDAYEHVKIETLGSTRMSPFQNGYDFDTPVTIDQDRVRHRDASDWDAFENHPGYIYNKPLLNKITSPSGDAVAEMVDNGDDTAMVITGAELHVGTVGNPKESAFGGGDSYSVDQAWHCDIANTTGLTITGATDVTSELSSDAGSTAGLFGGITAGKYLLIGSDYSYRGLKIKMTALGDVPPDNLRAEAWNGDGDFEDVQYMAANSDNIWSVGTQKGYNICTSLSEQWRFGFNPLDPVPNNKTTLIINGVPIEKYWGRLVIETPIAEDPTVEQIKLHPDRTEINSDGTVEHFGVARDSAPIPYVIEANADASPLSSDVEYGEGTTATGIWNKFSNTADDGFLVTIGINSGVDTSIPIAIRMDYYVDGASTGDIRFHVDSYQVSSDFIYDGTAVPESYIMTETVGAPNSLGKRTVIFRVSAEKLSAGDILKVSIRRNAQSDGADNLGSALVRTEIGVIGWLWK